MAAAQAIQIIVTVLLVATSAVVFVVAIGVFVALTLHKFGRLPRSPDHTNQSARQNARREISSRAATEGGADQKEIRRRNGNGADGTRVAG
jgi:hypothetical protein